MRITVTGSPEPGIPPEDTGRREPCPRSQYAVSLGGGDEAATPRDPARDSARARGAAAAPRSPPRQAGLLQHPEELGIAGFPDVVRTERVTRTGRYHRVCRVGLSQARRKHRPEAERAVDGSDLRNQRPRRRRGDLLVEAR